MYWLYYYYYYFGNTRNHVLKNYEKPLKCIFQTRYKFKKLKPSFFKFLDGEILCVYS